MKYTFQYFTDIATSASSMQVITIDAGGNYLMQRCRHLLPAYKYMKMGKISVKLLPASTLPVDPAGLSYDSSDPLTVDPRDQMNPGLVRITNGEDIYTNVSALSDDQQIRVYNNMMLDARWSKFMLQSGFRRSARPLYWQIGQLHQDNYPGVYVNYPLANADYNSLLGTATFYSDTTGTTDSTNNSPPGGNIKAYNSSPRGIFQTGHKGRMGWIPTDSLYELADRTDGGTESIPLPNAMPSVNCITVILPKAFKTLYYYRLFVTETVYFSGIKNFGITNNEALENVGLDNFLRPGQNIAMLPQYPYPGKTYQIKISENSTPQNRSYAELNDGSDKGGIEHE